MTQKVKNFSLRRFVSVATLCAFIITGLSGIIMLTSNVNHSAGPSEYGVNWKGLHEVGCLFFLFFGIWHLILNFKALCGYFIGSDTGKLAFRLDWFIPVILATMLFITVCFIQSGKHENRSYEYKVYEKRSRAWHH